MGDFLERLERLKIKVKSPTGLMVGEFLGRSGFEVRFSKPIREYDPVLVQAELDTVVKAFLSANRRAMESIVGEKWVGADPELDSGGGAFRKEIAEILVRVKSSRENVLVQMGGKEVLSVRLRPGITTRMDVTEERLAAEINDALKQAMNTRDKQVLAIQEKHLGLDWQR